MAEQRQIDDIEIGIELEDGEQRWTSVSAVPLPFDDWRYGGSVGIGFALKAA